MAFLIDDILLFPLKFPVWIGKKIEEAAYQELIDESKVREELLALQMRLEMGEITDEEYEKEETTLMERLEAIRKLKEQREGDTGN